MTNRGLIIVSTLFGLFAMCFGILGARAITVGPDAPTLDKAALAKRTAAANALEQRIRLVAGRTPPKLPAIPGRIARPLAATAAGGGTAVATPIAMTVRSAPQAKSGPSPGGGTSKGERESEAGDHGDD